MSKVADTNNNDTSHLTLACYFHDELLSQHLYENRKCDSLCKNYCCSHSIQDETSRICHGLLTKFKCHSLCDATLSADEKICPVHRVVLMAGSDYFRGLFTTTLHSRRKTEIDISVIQPSILKFLLHYLYSQEAVLCVENVVSILEAADYLGILSLREHCMSFIQSNITPQNVLSIRRFGRNMFCQEIFVASHKYLMKNFAGVTHESDELVDLTLDEMLEIFQDDELNVKNEELVWEAAIKWIDHKPEERKVHIVDLLRQIRTGLMETQYFMENVKDHPYVHGNEACRPIVIETLRFLLQFTTSISPFSMDQVSTPGIAKPRIPHEILFAIGGWSGGSPTNFIETYDTRADRWVRVEEVDPAGPRAYHGTISVGVDVFIVGGFDGVDYFNSCRAFNAVTKQWRNIACMHSRRCYVSVALVGSNAIYAMGGYDGHHRQNTCEKYDIELNQWMHIAPMNCQRSDASATTISDKVYICGGFNGIECLNSCESYSPEVNQWTLIAPMRNRRSGVSCINYHETLYVVGGFNGISRMCSGEKYNIELNSWIPIPDMYNPRSNFAIEVIDDLMFCIGGFTGTSTTYNVECFDQKTNEWYEATDMNIFRSALSACVITHLPNIYDYIHQQRDRLMEEKRQRLLIMQQQQRT